MYKYFGIIVMIFTLIGCNMLPDKINLQNSDSTVIVSAGPITSNINPANSDKVISNHQNMGGALYLEFKYK